jgi:hypothetical protein
MIDYSDVNFVINCAKKKGYIDICSIDIGNRNFALCIERLHFPIDKSENIIHQGEIILFRKEDFGARTKDGLKDRSIFLKCQKFLESISEYLDKCDIVLLEQQLKRNPFAQKLEMFVYSYLLFTYSVFKYYISFSATHKTQVLKAPKGMDKPARKKWCTNQFCEILANRGDEYSLEIIKNNKNKLDDLCDTGCMIQAWKILNYKKLISS